MVIIFTYYKFVVIFMSHKITIGFIIHIKLYRRSCKTIIFYKFDVGNLARFY